MDHFADDQVVFSDKISIYHNFTEVTSLLCSNNNDLDLLFSQTEALFEMAEMDSQSDREKSNHTELISSFSARPFVENIANQFYYISRR